MADGSTTVTHPPRQTEDPHALPAKAIPPTAAASPLRGHIPELDGVRGLAIVLVMLCHFIPHADHPASLAGRIFFFVGRAGWCGVDLFFVLSGFLITGILLDDRGDRHYFRNFYARRTLRIFPLYYGVLAFIFLVMPVVWPAAFVDPGVRDVQRHQGWLWTYTTNLRMTWLGDMDIFRSGWLVLNAFWSLAVEEHFYLLWPAIVYFCSRRTLVGICVFIGFMSLGMRGAFFHHDPDTDAVYVFTLCRADALAAGALLAVLLRTNRVPHVVKRSAPFAMVVLGAAWLISLGLDPAREHWFGATVGYTLSAGFFAALLVSTVTATPGNLLKTTFKTTMLRNLGKYSYGIYVYHDLLNNQFDKWFGQHKLEMLFHDRLHLRGAAYGCSVILFILLASAASFAVAWVSWQVYEKQFLKLKRYFAYQPAGKVVEVHA